MSYIYFGTPYVARDTLAALADAGYLPDAVVTNPDAPRGRGHIQTPSETKVWAQAHGIPVITPQALDAAAIETIKQYGSNYGICAAYGRVLPIALIDSFPQGILNIHYSLLPKYRGASPVEAALLHGDTVTGVTIQQMVAKLDAGDILAQKEVLIEPDDTTVTLRSRLVREGAALLIETLPRFLSQSLTPQPQEETSATHAGKIKKEDGELDLSAPAAENWNKYRAYAEWPGTYFFTERNGSRIRVKVTRAMRDSDGTFRILRVIPEGKKEIDFDLLQKS